MADDLIPLYKEMAENGVNFPGLAILSHRAELKKLMRLYEAKRVLDYGCGRGEQYRAPHRLHADWGLRWFEVTLYDPAFRRFAERPYGKFDAVLCSDVLEHIPEEEVEDTIGELLSLATKFVWASVCCRPAKKTFPDGRNLHVTLHPVEWWQEKFREMRSAMDLKIPFYLTETP